MSGWLLSAFFLWIPIGSTKGAPKTCAEFIDQDNTSQVHRSPFAHHQHRSPVVTLTTNCLVLELYLMIVFLLLATTVSWLRADAKPISVGPTTIPTIAHIVLGMSARSGCSDVRSVYDILRSCLFTIAACVYRAIHPNIPNSKLSFWGRLGVTFKIVIYALIAPELMIMWALRQRFGASQVAKEVNRVMAKKIRRLKPELKWTQTHGQFAQMGGFARKGSKDVLYPKDLIILLSEGLIDVEDVQLSEKEINDKSKGDVLSKGLVAFQTTWFIFECITRLQQGLPLIELEVVTLAFATLNAITYGLWWHKPLNVLSPIYIHIRPVQTSAGGSKPQKDDVTTLEPEEEAFVGEESNEVDTVVNGTGEAIELRGNLQARDPEEETLIGDELKESDDVQVPTVAKGKSKALAMVQAVQGVVKAIGTTFAGMVEDIRKDVEKKGWRTTAANWLIGKPILPLVELSVDDGTDDDFERPTTHVATFYAYNIPKGKMALATLSAALVGMVFGAIHFISWHSNFPTHAHLLLWRISCVALVIQPCFLILADVLYITDERVSGFNCISEVVADIGALIFILGIILYVLARFCVIVLAFLTLRDIPLGAFTEISWTSYIPHF